MEGHDVGGSGIGEAAFFDLDRTLIAKPAMIAFARPLYRAGMITPSLVVRAAWSNAMFRLRGADLARMAKYRASGLRIIRGWDSAQVRTIVCESLDEVVAPLVFPAGIDLIREHRRAGRRVFLVSAEPVEIVEPVADLLGVDETIASRAELDAAGCYTGNSVTWCHGPHKAVAIRDAADRLGLDLTASFAYSDSATDLPMLEAVGRPVVVNPDRALGRIAEERSWPVRRFDLRGAVPVAH